MSDSYHLSEALHVESHQLRMLSCDGNAVAKAAGNQHARQTSDKRELESPKVPRPHDGDDRGCPGSGMDNGLVAVLDGEIGHKVVESSVYIR